MNSKLKLFSKIVGVVLLFSAGLIIVSVVFPLSDKTFRPVNARNLRNRIKLIWLQVFGRILNLKVEVEGEAADGAAMIVGNHVSWLDIVAIGRHLPGYFVAKNDILSWPVVGFISRQVGTVFVARGDKQAIHTTTEQMTWLLKQNAKVFAFPEGTTTDGSDVLPFHSSLLQPALLTRSSLQPVCLSYQGEAKALAPFIGDDEFVPHLVKMLSLPTIRVYMRLLPPLDCDGKSRRQLADEARASIQSALANEAAVNPDPIPLPSDRKKLSGF